MVGWAGCVGFERVRVGVGVVPGWLMFLAWAWVWVALGWA